MAVEAGQDVGGGVEEEGSTRSARWVGAAEGAREGVRGEPSAVADQPVAMTINVGAFGLRKNERPLLPGLPSLSVQRFEMWLTCHPRIRLIK